MEDSIDLIPGGGVTSPRGFLAGATSAGIRNKQNGRLDLGILYSEVTCTAAAVFSTNKVKAAPLILSEQKLQKNRVKAVIINSGCANSNTGKQGIQDAQKMGEWAASHVGAAVDEVQVSSTGVIGTYLPMERIRSGIERIVLSTEGGHELAQAIMTTDTVPKEVAVKAGDFIIGGMAKGSGMIHPDLATMLCFLTTDADVEVNFLKESLKKAVDVSFNMLSVDGDNSTNDTVLIMANGKAGGEKIVAGSRQAGVFGEALEKVCLHLTREIARDGEGATKLIEITVCGAASDTEARMAARTIVSSSLVKAAVHGSDPNWGRVVAAAGRSGVELVTDSLELEIGGFRVVNGGEPVLYDKDKVVKHMDGQEVFMKLDLHIGSGKATAWGCDLSEEYVTINSDYTT
jgi:glutamate N-acetyltransferase/amino-acid N-acetyltransferase